MYADSRGSFHLEIRNWYENDLRLGLHVPDAYVDLVRELIGRAESVKLGKNGELLEGGEGLPYSVRVVRCSRGYQVLISFEVEEPRVEWNGRLAGVDINPEGIACTIVSMDGNLMATRFFRDSRLISASRNKRKWVLENIVNKMLRWTRDTHGCNAIAIEGLMLKGAYDYSPATNFKLSNFMKRKMFDVIRLHALKMDMLVVEVNPAYSSMVAIVKYGRQFGGFNTHQLAGFVIARRALGYGEAPMLSCLPKAKKERSMWNHCVRYYGYQPQVRTWPHHEPMERKSDGDDKGGRVITELLRARPTNTSGEGLCHDAPVINRAGLSIQANRHKGRWGASIQTDTLSGEMEQQGTELALRR